MTHPTQPGTLQDDAKREVDNVIDQRAQQIDPAGRNRVDLNRAANTPPEAEDEGAPQPGEEEEHPIRPAGRKEMSMPPREWTRTDEESDESFPASDPPGNY